MPIPDDIPDEVAAIFDPFGNAVHTALSFDLVGEDVLVTGAGPIGIMGALVAKRAGARKVVITDINPARLDLARRMGVDHVVDASREDLADVMRAIGMREGFDVGLEMSGAAPAFRDMIDKMNNGGKIAILGIAPAGFEIDWNKVIFKMLTLKGIYGREMFETWYKMIALVQSGLDVTPLITHRLPISDFERLRRHALRHLRQGRAGLGRRRPDGACPSVQPKPAHGCPAGFQRGLGRVPIRLRASAMCQERTNAVGGQRSRQALGTPIQRKRTSQRLTIPLGPVDVG